MGNESKWCKGMVGSLLGYTRDKGGVVWLTNEEIAEVVGLVNKDYLNRPKWTRGDTPEIVEFKIMLRAKIKDCLSSLFRSLDRQKLAIVTNSYLVQREFSDWEEASEVDYEEVKKARGSSKAKKVKRIEISSTGISSNRRVNGEMITWLRSKGSSEEGINRWIRDANLVPNDSSIETNW